MSATRYQPDPRDVVPHAAAAYRPAGDRWQHTQPPVALPGPGTLFTTADDLDRWLGHLHEQWQQAKSSLPYGNELAYRAADHEPYLYGPGLYANLRPGQTAAFHYGHEHGFSAATHLTRDGQRVVCLANTTDLAADHAAAAVLRKLDERPGQGLEELLPLAVAESARRLTKAAEEGHEDSEGQPHRELGRFTCDQVPGILRLTRTGDTLHLWRRGSPDHLVPAGPVTWAGNGYTLTLPRDTVEVDGFTLDLDRAPGLPYVRLRPT